MSPSEIFTRSSFWTVNLNYILRLLFTLYFHMWIRILILDPEDSWIRNEYGSGSTILGLKWQGGENPRFSTSWPITAGVLLYSKPYQTTCGPAYTTRDDKGMFTGEALGYLCKGGGGGEATIRNLWCGKINVWGPRGRDRRTVEGTRGENRAQL